MSKSLKLKIIPDQRGTVAILATLLIIVLISMISLSFARLVWREQRQSLDRQLSAQAFYAAETGVNDAVEALRTGAQNKDDIKDTCDHADWENPFIDGAGQVSYTCILIDPHPTELKFDRVDSDQSAIFPLRRADGLPLNSITIEWTNTDGGTNHSCPPTGYFPGSWPCDLGVLRVDLAKFGTPKSRVNLIDETFSAVFYPQSGGGSVNFADGTGLYGAGAIINGGCSGGVCRVQVTGMSETFYYARIRSIYTASRVTVLSDAPGVRFAGAQTVIDSTGRVSDVLRRIQVRVPLTPEGEQPDFALQTADGFCKRFRIAAGSVSHDIDSGCDPTTVEF